METSLRCISCCASAMRALPRHMRAGKESFSSARQSGQLAFGVHGSFSARSATTMSEAPTMSAYSESAGACVIVAEPTRFEPAAVLRSKVQIGKVP